MCDEISLIVHCNFKESETSTVGYEVINPVFFADAYFNSHSSIQTHYGNVLAESRFKKTEFQIEWTKSSSSLDYFMTNSFEPNKRTAFAWWFSNNFKSRNQLIFAVLIACLENDWIPFRLLRHSFYPLNKVKADMICKMKTKAIELLPDETVLKRLVGVEFLDYLPYYTNSSKYENITKEMLVILKNDLFPLNHVEITIQEP